jgi:hypothetical protein
MQHKLEAVGNGFLHLSCDDSSEEETSSLVLVNAQGLDCLLCHPFAFLHGCAVLILASAKNLPIQHILADVARGNL